jgi:hypothetical protein
MKGEIEVPEMSADMLIVVIVFILLVALALKILGSI